MTLEGALETRRTEDDGAPVEFVFTITNTGSEPLEVQFADAASAEFIVYDGGQEVWRFTEGQAFMQLLSSDRLEPGESATYDGEWPDPQPGAYTAVAQLRAQEATCEARAEFSVEH
ncbi:BsuPI-related putative proteinase inhibitor [Natronolimnobius baerhuensis]|uniref:Intracellular proteinase inhibitor BsuPI domain-containing protein n=1 Tax=Natronolimnobius baerhuensis TaxID=253108 RepID=A0A202E9A8_9EURY|nr:BsuPI-related putative proteinase inhibitor [Natronolimnobius baerhuensis]OVE84789.1 hypothetical protein B2G88_10445 [Natronolimnobius baerhuensis]